MLIILIDGADCDAVDTVGIAIKVAVVVASCAITCGEDVDGAFATTTFLDGSHHSFLDKKSRSLHSPSIIRRAP